MDTDELDTGTEISAPIKMCGAVAQDALKGLALQEHVRVRNLTNVIIEEQPEPKETSVDLASAIAKTVTKIKKNEQALASFKRPLDSINVEIASAVECICEVGCHDEAAELEAAAFGISEAVKLIAAARVCQERFEEFRGILYARIVTAHKHNSAQREPQDTTISRSDPAGVQPAEVDQPDSAPVTDPFEESEIELEEKLRREEQEALKRYEATQADKEARRRQRSWKHKPLRQRSNGRGKRKPSRIMHALREHARVQKLANETSESQRIARECFVELALAAKNFVEKAGRGKRAGDTITLVPFDTITSQLSNAMNRLREVCCEDEAAEAEASLLEVKGGRSEMYSATRDCEESLPAAGTIFASLANTSGENDIRTAKESSPVLPVQTDVLSKKRSRQGSIHRGLPCECLEHTKASHGAHYGSGNEEEDLARAEKEDLYHEEADPLQHQSLKRRRPDDEGAHSDGVEAEQPANLHASTIT
ncbi:hypothetical protein M427DRAFT_70490 [Gonapodya prolifera JEL478]|uniref:Uncharacterized protein n=1 Tax=Gonapodya prolifera (strain JEL478) TaxID=1344416 RepID=A0A139ADQ5_GONPJ|nr:hypothetical protein M427DRAFT_70490 [Gonapodya prolifera JEL478]|eukprot:KXS14724.1 hypothetical protein M427DRAFT_70490 [Gonapodya prolifera JEL478]